MNTKIIKRNIGKIRFLLKNYLLITVFSIFLIDRIIKEIIIKNNFFHLKNYGISLGLLQNLNWLILNSIILSIIILFWTFNNDKNMKNSLYYIIIGGLGNLIDRILYGAVIDYIPFIFTYINLSDFLISLGLINYIIFVYLKK